jgi:hypothetical protein
MLQEHSIKATSLLIRVDTTARPQPAGRRPAGDAQKLTGKKPADPRSALPASEESRVRGRDGKLVTIPAGFVAAEGRDGRVVAIPSGSGSLEGSDGRVVAIPAGHLGIENPKGRVVPKLRW